MELTTDDKQRIEQEAGVYCYSLHHLIAFKTGAEYATIYERQQQIELEKELIMKVAHSFYGVGAVGWDMNPGQTWDYHWNNFIKDGTLPPSEWRGRIYGKGRWDTMKIDVKLVEAERTELRNKVIELEEEISRLRQFDER